MEYVINGKIIEGPFHYIYHFMRYFWSCHENDSFSNLVQQETSLRRSKVIVCEPEPFSSFGKMQGKSNNRQSNSCLNMFKNEPPSTTGTAVQLQSEYFNDVA